ncbi:MAG: hypothetical protein M0D54_12105 [Hyphomonadaceae bacterium JAD_PAG50586_4]|nr:MAG: hypothetical protein M0D54_12105 [Hyphomonadaceae bacterium JAD_PAG50586_4]
MRPAVQQAANDATCALLEGAPECVDVTDLVNSAFVSESVEDVEPPFDPRT